MPLHTLILTVTEGSRRSAATQAEEEVPRSIVPVTWFTAGDYPCIPRAVLVVSYTVTWAAGHEGTMAKAFHLFSTQPQKQKPGSC